MGTLAESGWGGLVFYLIVFAVIVLFNVLRGRKGGEEEAEEDEGDQPLRSQKPAERSRPARQSDAAGEIDKFLEELSRKSGAPVPRPSAPKPPPVARPEPSAQRPASAPRPASSSHPQPTPPPTAQPIPSSGRQRPAPREGRARPPVAASDPRPTWSSQTVRAPSEAPLAARHVPPPPPPPPPPAPARPSQPATSPEAIEGAAARIERLLPKSSLQRAIVLSEIIGPCRAKKPHRPFAR